MTPDRLEEHTINWLGSITVVGLVGAVVLALFGQDSTITVAVLGVSSVAAGSIATRRSKLTADPAPDPSLPPPYTGGPP